MRTLYLECNMGAAGDMLSASLLELMPDPDAAVARLNALGIPGITFSAEKAVKCGICGTHLKVTVNGEEEKSLDVHAGHETHGHSHEEGCGHLRHDREEEPDHHPHDHDHGEEDGHHHHHHDHDPGEEDGHHPHGHAHHRLSDIEKIVKNLPLPQEVQVNIMQVYHCIAEAESHAHGRPVEEVHFHEVGAMDAVADITAFCLLLHELAPDRVLASPVKTGFGEVRCAHGILPVPAPATAFILQGIPAYAGEIRGEMCTPTGAAILKSFAEDFCTLPPMQVQRIGIGCGKKDFPQANCVRAFWGETPDSRETVIELACNLDDMTPEAVGFAMEELLSAGAVDVYTIPVTMKKSRPGFLLTCMCHENMREKMLELLFRHTTTLGVREYTCNRYTMERMVQTLQTPVGDIRVKNVHGWGTAREKYEYDDLAKAARSKGISLAEAARCADESRRT